MPTTHRYHQKERGQSLVEFALVLPILLLLMMGILDLGRFLFLYSQTMNGAREGARYGSVSGLNTSPTVPQYIDCAGIRAAAIRTNGLASQPTITIEYDHGTDPVLNQGCEDVNNRPSASDILPGDRIRVSVEATYDFLTPGLRNVTGPITVTFTSARTVLAGGTVVPPPFP